MVDIRAGNCPVCNWHEIIEAPLKIHNTDRGTPVALVMRQHLLSRDDFGYLRAYSCRRCGLTQLFADAPADVPIGEKDMTRLITGVPEDQSSSR